MAVVGDAYVVVRAMTQQFERDVENAINRLKPQFDSLGDGLNDSLRRSGRDANGLFGNLGKEADQARMAFNRMIRASYVLQPAIAGVVSSISDLIFALGGMIAGIGRAAPALAVLAGGFVAVAQAGIAAKLAFGGVGAAIQALLKEQGAAGAGAAKKGKVKDDPAVKAAKKALDRAMRDKAEMEMEFQRDLADAKVAHEKAQQKLNQAYKEGAEAIQQLRFQAEGAVLSEQRAAIELERAREALMRAQDLPPDSRARREAELAFKEADLNYRMALDRTSDLREEVEYANRTGIDGTDAVISAKEDLAEAEEKITRMLEDYALDQIKANEKILDAYERLQDAKKRARDELNKLPPAVQAVQDAMKDLSPEAQRFARFIAGLRPEFLKLRAAAGKNLFGPLETAIQQIVDKLFPVLIPILRRTGGAIGDVAVAFSNMLTAPGNLDIFKRVFGEANIKVIRNLGLALVNVLDLFLSILDAVSPLVVEFSKFIKQITGDWAKNAKADGEGLRDMFNGAAEAAKTIGGAIAGLFRGFKAFGKLAADMGLDLFKSLGMAGDAMADFFTPKTQAEADAFDAKFKQIGENTKSIGRFLGEVMKFLFEMAGNPGVQAFFDAIAVIPMMFADSGNELTGLGKTMGEFFVQFAKVLNLFIETGGIEMFFKILTGALKLIEDAFSNETVRQVFLFLASLKGVTLALGTIGKILKFFGLATVVSGLKGIFGFFKPDKLTGISKFQGVLTSLKNLGPFITKYGPKFLKFGGIIGLVVGAIMEMWQNSEIFRESIGNLVGGVWEALQRGFETIKDALEDAAPAVETLSGGMDFLGKVFGVLGDILGKTVIPALEWVLTTIIDSIAGVIAGAIRAIKGIIQVIGGLVDFIAGIFTGDFSRAWDGIKKIFSGLKDFFLGALQVIWNGGILKGFKLGFDALKGFFTNTFIPFVKSIPSKFGDLGKGLWDGLVKGFKIAYNWIAKKWNSFAIELRIPSNFITDSLGISGKGFKLDTPDLPILTLAKGGVVYPQSGGVAAIIAEAGQAERVEPLDSSGFSKRDYRIIDFLEDWREINSKGGNRNVVINVNPSPGMDERLLAMTISRRIERQRLRGM